MALLAHAAAAFAYALCVCVDLACIAEAQGTRSHGEGLLAELARNFGAEMNIDAARAAFDQVPQEQRAEFAKSLRVCIDRMKSDIRDAERHPDGSPEFTIYAIVAVLRVPLAVELLGQRRTDGN